MVMVWGHFVSVITPLSIQRVLLMALALLVVLLMLVVLQMTNSRSLPYIQTTEVPFGEID